MTMMTMVNMSNMSIMLFLSVLLLSSRYVTGVPAEIRATDGDPVLLPCPVNTQECGAYHSLKWYHEDTRVYVFSPTAQFMNAEGALMNRCLDPSQESLGPDCVRGSLEVTDQSVDLRISPLEHADEGEYRCEITYLDISTNCPVVHFTQVTTVAAPKSVTITNQEDEDISGQVVGPYPAGKELHFSCQSEGKPPPAVTWKLGADVVEGETREEEEETGSWSVRSAVVVMLDREHTGASLACIVEHQELDEPIGAQIQIDVNVPVSSVSMESDLAGQEGVEMSLTCVAVGGRPEPTFSWVMPSSVEYQQEDSSSLLDDETFESVSKLRFIPRAEHNNKEVECHAINNVMDEALQDRIKLFVQYAPKVNIKEENETVVAGDDVTIDCEIDANPAELSAITWFHNDNPLDVSEHRITVDNSGDQSQLSINPAETIDAGEYSCSAENSVGETRSTHTFYLEVISPVESVSIQEDLTGMLGEEMVIGCTALGARPAATILWSLSSTEEFSFEAEEEVLHLDDNTFETSSKIKFTPSKQFNGEEIICQATNEAMEEMIADSDKLNILYPPSVSFEEDNMTLSARDELIIPCEIDANPGNITFVQWFHNGEEVGGADVRVHTDPPALSLSPVQVSDGGDYLCVAENTVGRGQSQILSLHVIAVVESVVITEEVGTEEEEMTLTCYASGGYPASTVTWLLPEGINFSVEEEVIVNEDETLETISKLTFTPSANEHEKKVICEAINDVMDAAVEYETELNILYKPIATVDDANITVTAGDQITLDCMVDANPMNLSQVHWFHNEEVIDVNNWRLVVGNSEVPSITITEIVAKDSGDYFCVAANQLGQSLPSPSINLEVIYPPKVTIRKDPDTVLTEEHDMNVTLHCELVDGNPAELSMVFWFWNGELMRQLPDLRCAQAEERNSEIHADQLFISEAGDYELGSGFEESGMEDFGSAMEMGSGLDPDHNNIEVNYLCDVDPAELLLQHVTRDFSGEFSCSASNAAGEGPESEPILLDILYIPGQAVITQEEKAEKGESVTLFCNLEYQGNPRVEEYLWKRGEDVLSERSANLTLHDLGVESQGPVSCAGGNAVGEGEQDSLNITVLAAPYFLESLPDETMFVSHDTNLFLQCKVECFPLCRIQWVKNSDVISSDDDRFTIEESIIPEDVDSNQFQSVISKLSWNLENTSNNKLDHEELNFTVSCFVEETYAHAGISSSSEIQVEYAPENIEISTTFITIREHDVINPIYCGGEGVPEPVVLWKFDEKAVTNENTLDFSDPLKREQGGVYTCHVSNNHGEEVVNVTIDVVYEPECKISHRLEDEEVVLLCRAEANPQDVTFVWERKNITFDGQKADTLESEVRMKIMNESVGTYYCHVSNSLGPGERCQIDLTMEMMTYGLSEEVMVILIAIAGSVIVLLIIIIIIACLYCGEKKETKGPVPKKKTKDKSPLLKDDQLHADSSFYENLPFKGLRSPPKQVLDDCNSDYLDYADADYLDIYANGPLKYREASEKNATLRRKKLEERKAVKSELL